MEAKTKGQKGLVDLPILPTITGHQWWNSLTVTLERRCVKAKIELKRKAIIGLMGRKKIIPEVRSLHKNTYSSHGRHNSATSSILCSAYGVNFNVLTYNTIHTHTKYYTCQMRLSYSCWGKHNFEFPDFGAFNLNHNVTLTSVLHFISQVRIASASSPVCTGKKKNAG